METIEVEISPLSQAHMMVYDESGRPVLLIQVKQVTPVRESIVQLTDAIRDHYPPIPFGMLVDPEQIRIYGDRGIEPVAALRTTDVLSQYDPKIAQQPSYERNLWGLIPRWLDDLSYRWYSAEPPALDVVSQIGLADLLKESTIKWEVPLVRRPLR